MIFLLMLVSSSFVLTEILRLPECSKFDGEFSVKVDGRVLAKDLLMRLKSLSYFDCLFKCVSHKKCKSINYSEKSKECELCSKNSRDAKVVHEERHGWSFYETPHHPVENLGPICRQMSPCKHGSCRDVCQKPGYVCSCDHGYVGLNCDKAIAVGLNQETAAPSCLEIRNQYGANSPPSGMYWIMTTQPVQMYCDMNVDGGGWTKVANVNNTSNSLRYSQLYFHDELETIDMIESPFYALTTSGLATLRQFINFTSIRIYCNKPSVNRTVHIVTASNSLGLEVVRYMTGSSQTPPASCNSYVKMPDDDSVIARDCYRWASQSWSISYAKSTELLYDIAAYISGRNHIIAGSRNRFECDDYLGSKIGIWMFFVR